MNVDYNLERFVKAQEGVHERALEEIASGRKRTHWMWFAFPQLACLGWSDMSRKYAISGLPEARAYVAHPVLGKRLERMFHEVTCNCGIPAEKMFGPTDAMKLHSSATLFHYAAEDGSSLQTYCREVVQEFFRGKFCDRTDFLLGVLRDENGERFRRAIDRADHGEIDRYIHDPHATVPGYLALLDRITQETGFGEWDCMCIGAACHYIREHNKQTERKERCDE